MFCLYCIVHRHYIIKLTVYSLLVIIEKIFQSFRFSCINRWQIFDKMYKHRGTGPENF